MEARIVSEEKKSSSPKGEGSVQVTLRLQKVCTIFGNAFVCVIACFFFGFESIVVTNWCHFSSLP